MICPKCSAAICQRGGRHYILGEKLRGKSKEASAALSRQGRYHTVAGNLRVKEVIIDDGTMRDRFVVCHNPEEAAPTSRSASNYSPSSPRRLVSVEPVGDRPGGGGVE